MSITNKNLGVNPRKTLVRNPFTYLPVLILIFGCAFWVNKLSSIGQLKGTPIHDSKLELSIFYLHICHKWAKEFHAKICLCREFHVVWTDRSRFTPLSKFSFSYTFHCNLLL